MLLLNQAAEAAAHSARHSGSQLLLLLLLLLLLASLFKHGVHLNAGRDVVGDAGGDGPPKGEGRTRTRGQRRLVVRMSYTSVRLCWLHALSEGQ